MKALLSIRPQFAAKIFSGEKKYEYRRQIFKKEIDTVVVYASSPIKKVIGEFKVERIECNELDLLWKNTCDHSGITQEYFYSYFINKDYGYAIKIRDAVEYSRRLDLREAYGILPPQSFAYI